MIDRRGIGSFLLLTFGMTFVYEACLIGSGMSMNFAWAAQHPMWNQEPRIAMYDEEIISVI